MREHVKCRNNGRGRGREEEMVSREQGDQSARNQGNRIQGRKAINEVRKVRNAVNQVRKGGRKNEQKERRQERRHEGGSKRPTERAKKRTKKRAEARHGAARHVHAHTRVSAFMFTRACLYMNL